MKRFLTVGLLTIGVLSSQGVGLTGPSISANGSGSSSNTGTNTSATGIGHTVFADTTYGTANVIRNRLDKPALTISNAITASKSNDLIYCSGLFNDVFLFRSNTTSYYFPAGSGVYSTNNTDEGSIFTDYVNIARTNEVSGYGNFTHESPITATVGVGAIFLQNSNSVLDFTANSINVKQYSGDGGSVAFFGGFGIYISICAQANIYVNHMTVLTGGLLSGQGQGGGAFSWTGGNCNFTFDTILTDTQPAIQVQDAGAFDGAFVLAVQGKYLSCFSTNVGQNLDLTGTGVPLFWYGDQSLLRQESFVIDFIEAQQANAIMDGIGGGGKIYVRSIKISNHSTNCAVLAFGSTGTATNQLWLDAQKVTDNLGGGLYYAPGGDLTVNNTNNSNMKLYVHQWEEKSLNWTKGIQIGSGTYTINSGTLVMPNGQGLSQTNGVVTLNNMIIDTSLKGSPTNWPIFLQGSPNLTINGGQLIASNGIPCIWASNSITVNINGTSLSSAVQANVNVLGNYTVAGVPFHGNNPAIQVVSTNGIVTAASITIAWPVAYRDTNYVAQFVPNGGVAASAFPSAKTTTTCTFNMTAFTGGGDIMATH